MELPAWDDLQYTQRFWFMLGVDCALGLDDQPDLVRTVELYEQMRRELANSETREVIKSLPEED
jgi:hypothetical protein